MDVKDKCYNSKQPVTVVIPTYNEEHTIAEVIRGAMVNVPHARILVIDDGSTDQTSKEAINAGA
ncbi:MAG: glycosyltransferase, partial [Desulfomonilaceae bacterium]